MTQPKGGRAIRRASDVGAPLTREAFALCFFRLRGVHESKLTGYSPQLDRKLYGRFSIKLAESRPTASGPILFILFIWACADLLTA